jgi:hypothetical protein
VDGWRIVEVRRISGRPLFGYQQAGSRAQVFEEPTGWQKVDRQVQEVRLRLDTAEAEKQLQAVGLLCREALISVAQEVFDPLRHKAIDGTLASDTDAKRMLEAFMEAELGGSSNEEARCTRSGSTKACLGSPAPANSRFQDSRPLCGGYVLGYRHCCDSWRT